jgi:transposase
MPPGPRSPRHPVLTAEVRRELEQILRRPAAPAGLARRARIVLLAADGMPLRTIAPTVGVERHTVRDWLDRFLAHGLAGLQDLPRPGRPRRFPPEVELRTIDLACTRPDDAGRPVSQWDSTELARQLVADGIVERISPSTVQRMLARHRLKPWRCHSWLHPRRPCDAAFLAQVRAIADLSTRPLAPDEAVICFDEMTALAPRPRLVPTQPARPGRPVQVEHEYRRTGALNIFAAFSLRDGSVSASLCRRKRQQELLRFLDLLDDQLDATITRVHLVCDNVSTHQGKQLHAWLATHPRFCIHYTPVHSSWMNQVEQWFSVLRRKRLRILDFADLADLADAIIAFIADWNTHAHPFRWTTASFEKIFAKREADLDLTPSLQQAA